jgi:flagellar M-ring protein FliF
VLIVALLLGCVGAGVLLVQWARKPEMAMLYSGVSQEEAARIVEKIRDSKTAHELRDGGTSIYVPAGQVHSIRLSMASQGLPSDSQPGYSILDKESFGSSPFKQQINYKRALEGELAESVELIDGVVSARVHVVRPEGNVFSRDRRESSATVVLKLSSPGRLAGGGIDAIIHLVAGAVEGLSPEKVVVVDSGGGLLSGASEGDPTRKAGTFMTYKAGIEEYLSRKAENMLAAVLGPNKASVRVAATIKTSSISTVKETYDPTTKIATREEISSSSSNTADPKAAEGGGNGSTTKEETTSTDYLVGKTVEQTSEFPGQVESLSVAAFVDLTPAPAEAGQSGTAAQPAAAMTVTDVEEILRNALGLSTKDQLKVVSTTFSTPPLVEAEPADEGMFSLGNIMKMLRQASLGLLVLGALVLLKVFGGRKAGGDRPAAALEGASAGGDRLLSGRVPEIDPQTIRNRIGRALQDNPDEVKRLFLSWVHEGNGNGNGS